MDLPQYRDCTGSQDCTGGLKQRVFYKPAKEKNNFSLLPGQHSAGLANSTPQHHHKKSSHHVATCSSITPKAVSLSADWLQVSSMTVSAT